VSEAEDGSQGTRQPSGRPGARLLTDVAAYGVARLLLVAVLTGVIFGAAHLLGITEFPLVVALLFAIVVALPLGIWVFAPLRRRATASIAVFDERRRTDREQLRARLRGDDPSSK
jgi:antibiotic biosynthesis monooxygenase (ABM) superfamily enzyme